MKINRFFSSARRAAVMTALAALMSVALVACGGDTNPPISATNTPEQTSPVSPAQEYKVSLIEWGINPSDLEVSGGSVRFFVSNDGQFPHDLTIVQDGNEPKTIVFKKDDGPQTLDLQLAPGSYKMYCSVGDHEERGMVGQVIVK